MSHFSVLVVGPDLEKQLAPFQENNMGNCPEEYLAFNDVEDEYRKEYENDGVEMVKCPDGSVVYRWDDRFRVRGSFGHGSNTHKILENAGYEMVNVKHKDRFASFEEFIKEWAGYKERDAETGRFGYWENPNKKWDWYEIGGRWSGSLITKDGAIVDAAKKGDIDFDKMLQSRIERAEKAWTEAESKNEDDTTRYLVYGIEKEETKDQYMDKARKNGFSTFAVLKDGVWYERGEMGWFGCVGNEKKACNWGDEFMAIIDEIADDEMMTVVDCHI